MELDDLEDLFDDLDFISPQPSYLAKMLDIYNQDFNQEEFTVFGKSIKVVNKPSWEPEFKGYPETFVHLITRESNYKDKKPRQFDKWRANRIHWVKVILSNTDSNRIKCFEEIDNKGYKKMYFWFKENDFVVILKSISLELLVITGFYVEKSKRKDLDEKLQNYKSS
ncbi:hypothetical protein PBAC_26740 [Pedobacter glucosidilyticus]|nr:hypothetical protein [Pedobacter glucosidilyticus]KHJ37139.1 hypothetical protein PBAC_26740 [Pedobacter glucosidilyticus]